MARTSRWLVKETIVRTAIVVGVGAIASGLGSGSALAVPSFCDPIVGNLVKNCGFEKGDFTSWVTTPAASGSGFGVSGVPNSGNWGAAFYASSALDDTIMQSLATTLGSQYTVKFWLFNHIAQPFVAYDNEFKFLWNAIPLVTLVNAHDLAYTEHTFILPGSGSDLLTFQGRSKFGYYALDDVSVTVAAVPEPATLFLLGSGLAGLAAWRRRKAA